MLFQGEEWAASTPFQYFTDHQDANLAQAVRDGRRKEFAAFGWEPDDVPDPQSPETFARSKLKWDEIPESPHAATLEWYRRLIQLRRDNPSLRDGRLENVDVRYDESAKWLVVERGPITVAVNFNDCPTSVEMKGRHEVLISSPSLPAPSASQVELPPKSVAIFRSL
jgi:maltooligosyltrehalose trehalohydrolase